MVELRAAQAVVENLTSHQRWVIRDAALEITGAGRTDSALLGEHQHHWVRNRGGPARGHIRRGGLRRGKGGPAGTASRQARIAHDKRGKQARTGGSHTAGTIDQTSHTATKTGGVPRSMVAPRGAALPCINKETDSAACRQDHRQALFGQHAIFCACSLSATDSNRPGG